ncbi:MAG: hypothetical protein ACI9O6_003492 [Glaciecola sp.]|jgi:hypothetical protein
MFDYQFFMDAFYQAIRKKGLATKTQVSTAWILENCTQMIDQAITQQPQVFSEVNRIECIDSLVNRLESYLAPISIKPAYAAGSQKIKYKTISSSDLDNLPYYWAKFEENLRVKGRSEIFINSLNKDTNRILKLLPSPQQEDSFDSFGMVIGDVQAGKTGNYSALINKAADLGYKLIIVLAGMTENLRSQTQKRLDEDFVGATSVAGERVKGKEFRVGVGKLEPHYDKNVPFCITDKTKDFSTTATVRFKLESQNSPVVIVTKKNTSILTNILSWLPENKTPTLIIDDESDNASVNTSKEDEDPKAINRKIRLMIARCQKVAYVAYTATPYANIFIDPERQDDVDDQTGEGTKQTLEDLYPRDFIVALQAPTNYCGGDFFYSNNEEIEHASSVKVMVDDAEDYFPLKHRKDDPVIGLPPSLKMAIYEFYLAIAVKDLRRKRNKIPSFDKHDSMLINVSRFTAYQDSVASLVEVFVKRNIHQRITMENEGAGSIWSVLKELYEKKYKTESSVTETWPDIKQTLFHLSSTPHLLPEVCVIHGQSADVLEYEAEPKRYIAVGGFKLSRGLTLDGLVISYFYRKSIMYDTLMQMARWFGYRDGYKDLVRLYTTPECAEWYLHINEATKELKEYLVEMERQKIEPSLFGVKVRSTEEYALIVTAKNKMQATIEIEVSTNYSGKRYETFFVDSRRSVNENNKQYLFNLVRELKVNPQKMGNNENPNGYLYKDIPSRKILDLIKSIKMHRGNLWIRTGQLLNYLEQNAEGELKNWNLVLQSSREDSSEVPPLIINEDIKMDVGRRTTTFKRKSDLGRLPVKVEEAEYELPLGDRGRVSQVGMEKVDIPSIVLKENKIKTEKQAREYKSKHNFNPLLVAQFIGLDPVLFENDDLVSKHKNLIDEAFDGSKPYPYLAFYLSIPGKGEETSIKYVLNKNEIKERFGEAESDE